MAQEDEGPRKWRAPVAGGRTVCVRLEWGDVGAIGVEAYARRVAIEYRHDRGVRVAPGMRDALLRGLFTGGTIG